MYRVLYRKWRPKVFGDVTGQPQVTLTLSSQIKENRLSHAYLFTGSRGTGKTTCAKILAKAVNCLNPVDGNPCNECEICRGIDNGTILDIVEIDAASNRGIDDIRLLRDEVNFTPSKAKFRVYIIDEVHMLTIEAFNALLKTLEEPPEHVKFILATTEVHKLPSTILSRCQRFDFRRIEPKLIADRLMYIANEEKAVLHSDAAMLIARIADGGMRDAISLLDRAISVDNDVTTDVVSSSAGLMGREYIYDLVRALAKKDTAKSLLILDELHNASCDTERLCTELSNQFRNFLIIKTVKTPENLIVCTAEELEELKALANMFTSAQVLNALNVLTSAADSIKHTQNRRIEAEMALIRLCSPETDSDISALLARISVLEKELKEIKSGNIKISASAIGMPEREDETAKVQNDAFAPLTGTENVFDEAEFGEPEPLPENSLFGGSEELNSEQVPPTDDGDLPFGPDAGELPDIPVPPVTEFAGFGAEPEINSFGNRFSELEKEESVKISDDFMNKYGEEQSENSSAAEIQVASDTSVEGAVDKRTWVKIVLETERSYQPFIGQLTNSTAYIRGSTLFVCPANPFMKNMTRESVLAEKMEPIVKNVLGKAYQVKYN